MLYGGVLPEYISWPAHWYKFMNRYVDLDISGILHTPNLIYCFISIGVTLALRWVGDDGKVIE